MKVPGGVLVDTSVWISFFRKGRSPEARHLDGLLELGTVVTCAPIRAEVVSGAKTEGEFRQIRDLFSGLQVLESSQEVWDRLEAARFTLARRGIQASLIDLMIGSLSQIYHVPLWSLDKDFDRIRPVLSFPKYIPEPASLRSSD